MISVCETPHEIRDEKQRKCCHIVEVCRWILGVVFAQTFGALDGILFVADLLQECCLFRLGVGKIGVVLCGDLIQRRFREELLYIAREPVSILVGMALIVLFSMDSRWRFPLLTAKQDLAGFGSGTL